MIQVTGTVEDEEGGVVSRALVAIEEGTSPFPDMALSTDSEGHFTVFLPIGRFRFTAHSQDGKHGTVEYDSKNSDSLVIRLSHLK